MDELSIDERRIYAAGERAAYKAIRAIAQGKLDKPPVFVMQPTTAGYVAAMRDIVNIIDEELTK